MIAPNAIGNFQIGISPIGSLPTFDYLQTVISQYANSPILMQLLDNMYQYLDQTMNMESFYDVLYNIDTAQGHGLDVWGEIVGVNRVIPVQSTSAFGFEESGPLGVSSFGEGAFYSGGTLTNNVALSDDAYRILIFAKALSNITDGSITSCNQILLNLFPGRGNCYVVDNQNMTITYTFTFATTDVEKAIVQWTGILPKPTGVAINFSFV
jgi:hypothetical protein